MSRKDKNAPLCDDANGHCLTDEYLLDAIRARQTEAWSLLIERYQGRLFNFAAARLGQIADVEDVIQDTFVSFIRCLDNYRGDASLETYLFTILRNKIIDRYRSRQARSVSLVQDVYGSGPDSDQDNRWPDIISQVRADNPSVSWCLSQDEQCQLQRHALTEALRKLLRSFKDSLKFRNLKIVELLFYCNIPCVDTANLLNMKSSAVRVFKCRCLEQIRQDITPPGVPENSLCDRFENMLTDIWESQRLSCPKRSTIGAFLLEKLEPRWFDYVDFHLTTLGCHFCRANLKDLKQQKTDGQEQLFRRQIMASTIGFLSSS